MSAMRDACTRGAGWPEKNKPTGEKESREKSFSLNSKGRGERRGHTLHSTRLHHTAGLICCVPIAELQILMWCNNPCFWDTRGRKWIIKPTHLRAYTYCIHSLTHLHTDTLTAHSLYMHSHWHTYPRVIDVALHALRDIYLRDSTAFMWTQGWSSASVCMPISPEEPVTLSHWGCV